MYKHQKDIRMSIPKDMAQQYIVVDLRDEAKNNIVNIAVCIYWILLKCF